MPAGEPTTAAERAPDPAGGADGPRSPDGAAPQVAEPTRAHPELVAVAALAVVVGVVLRFVAPTPLWLDEALSANIAALAPGDLLEALRHDGHPPLYYLLLHSWMQVVGTGDAEVRALSGVLSVLSLPLIWVVARRRGGQAMAVVAVAVLALSPYALRYATETRMYALVMLEVLVGWLLLDDVLAGRGVRWRAPLLALTTGALVLTHYWGLFLVGAVGLVLVVGWVRAGPGEARSRRTAAIAALAVGGLAFAPWLGAFLYQAAHTGTPWAPAMRPSAVVGSTLQDLAAGDLDDAVAGAGLLTVLIVLGLLGRAVDARRVELDLRTTPTVRWPAAVALLALVLGAGAAFVSGSAYATRYAAVLVPLVLVVVAAGIVVVEHRVARLVLLVGVLAFGLVGAADQLTSERSQADAVAAAVRARVGVGVAGGTDARVVVCPDQLGPSLVRELEGPMAVDGGEGAGSGPPPVAPHGSDSTAPVDTYELPPRPGIFYQAPPGGPIVIPYPGGADLSGVGDADPRFVDWVDYAERNVAADPVAFAEAVLAATPDDASLFLVWNPSYRTFEGQCEALRATFSAARPGAQDLVRADGDQSYEHATLTWFPPVSP